MIVKIIFNLGLLLLPGTPSTSDQQVFPLNSFYNVASYAMARQNCIIHYDTIKTSDNLFSMNESSHETLIECKTMRKHLGGENCHSEQCSGTPINVGDMQYYYHRECNQKFTYARALKKRKLQKDEVQDPSAKLIRTKA